PREPGGDRRPERHAGQPADGGPRAPGAAGGQVPRLRVGMPGGGRPRLRPSRRSPRPAPGAPGPPERDDRAHRPRPRRPQPGGARRPLVRRPLRRGGGGAGGRAPGTGTGAGPGRRSDRPVMTYEGALLALAREREDLIVLTAENRAPIRSLADALGPR